MIFGQVRLRKGTLRHMAESGVRAAGTAPQFVLREGDRLSLRNRHFSDRLLDANRHRRTQGRFPAFSEIKLTLVWSCALYGVPRTGSRLVLGAQCNCDHHLPQRNCPRSNRALARRKRNPRHCAGCGDVLAFTRIHGTWISEEIEPVAIEFAWQRRRTSPAISEDDCVCAKELAARLIAMLLSGCERDEAGEDTLYVFSPEGSRVAIHRTELRPL